MLNGVPGFLFAHFQPYQRIATTRECLGGWLQELRSNESQKASAKRANLNTFNFTLTQTRVNINP